MNNNMDYLKKENNTKEIIKTEILFTPLLVIFPFIIGLFFIFDWYNRGFIEGLSGLESELLIGFIIIIGNLAFDIPFLKSLIKQLAKKNKK